MLCSHDLIPRKKQLIEKKNFLPSATILPKKTSSSGEKGAKIEEKKQEKTPQQQHS